MVKAIETYRADMTEQGNLAVDSAASEFETLNIRITMTTLLLGFTISGLFDFGLALEESWVSKIAKVILPTFTLANVIAIATLVFSTCVYFAEYINGQQLVKETKRLIFLKRYNTIRNPLSEFSKQPVSSYANRIADYSLLVIRFFSAVFCAILVV